MLKCCEYIILGKRIVSTFKSNNFKRDGTPRDLGDIQLRTDRFVLKTKENILTISKRSQLLEYDISENVRHLVLCKLLRVCNKSEYTTQINSYPTFLIFCY